MKNKEDLGWIEWLRGWISIIYEIIFQRILACHLKDPFPIPPMNGQTCIVTGCTSGIGVEIAKHLAEAGAHVVMACRSTGVAHELIKKWQAESLTLGAPLDVEVMELDLLSLDSVRRFAESWNARGRPLHVLINNAGIFSIGAPQHFSKDGVEEHMQVNFLAPSLLNILLLPSLVRGSPSRILNVNSIMHQIGFVDTDDMNIVSGKRKFCSRLAYCNSKLAQTKFNSILHKKIPAEAGINVMCVNPGVVQTNVTRSLPQFVQAAYQMIPFFLFSPREGARSSLFAATDPQIPEYCSLLKSDDWPVCACICFQCKPCNASEEAHNLETSRKVWDKTLELLGLPDDVVEKLIEGEEVDGRSQSAEE